MRDQEQDDLEEPEASGATLTAALIIFVMGLLVVVGLALLALRSG